MSLLSLRRNLPPPPRRASPADPSFCLRTTIARPSFRRARGEGGGGCDGRTVGRIPEYPPPPLASCLGPAFAEKTRSRRGGGRRRGLDDPSDREMRIPGERTRRSANGSVGPVRLSECSPPPPSPAGVRGRFRLTNDGGRTTAARVWWSRPPTLMRDAESRSADARGARAFATSTTAVSSSSNVGTVAASPPARKFRRRCSGPRPPTGGRSRPKAPPSKEDEGNHRWCRGLSVPPKLAMSGKRGAAATRDGIR